MQFTDLQMTMVVPTKVALSKVIIRAQPSEVMFTTLCVCAVRDQLF